MTLQLVINNSKINKRKNPITCRANCELFDSITNECGVHDIHDPDNPKIASRCGDIIFKEKNEDQDITPWERPLEYEFYNEEFENGDEMDEVFNEFKGEAISTEHSTYPLQPDVPAKRDDALWYVAPNEEFGCWIVNKSPQKFLSVSDISKAKQGWNEKVYKSPYPLHDHNSSLPLSSRMVWYVDSEGYGQYALLCAGKISMISHPRPSNWIE